jgi:hypothetical protein
MCRLRSEEESRGAECAGELRSQISALKIDGFERRPSRKKDDEYKEELCSHARYLNKGSDAVSPANNQMSPERDNASRGRMRQGGSNGSI